MSDTTSSAWPPAAPTTLAQVIPSYLYQQYSDDDDLQAFVDAYNAYAQGFLDWFRNLNLPIYTQLSGALLDWVGAGLYGFPRPVLVTGVTNLVAPWGTFQSGELEYGGYETVGSAQYVPVTDDVYQRILTWQFYKGDGQAFSTPWLKRRIHRFLNGANGTDVANDNTYDVSVTTSGSAFTIALTKSEIAQIFQVAVQNGVLALPFFYTYTVNLT